MTRILHILDHGLPLQSGYTFRTRAIMKAQQALGLDVRGITGPRHVQNGGTFTPDIDIVDGLHFYRTAAKVRGIPVMREWAEIGDMASRIAEVCRTWRPDVLHAHSPALNGMAALRVAERFEIPLVYEIRAFWEDAAVGNCSGREGSPRYWLTRQLENHVVASADHVVTICEGLKSDLIGRGFKPAKFSIMPNGVDHHLFGAPKPRDVELSRELGLDSADVLGFVGSFYDYEGLDDLVAAMPGVLKRRPDARLLLVGGGPCDNALKTQVEQLGLGDRVIFTGRVPHDAVDRYYSLIDLLVYPRKRMRLTELVTPLKPLEAMAQDKLVIASDVGGHRELIEHGVTGSLYCAGNSEALADEVVRMLTDRSFWDARRQTARDYVRTSRDWATNAARYLPVYESVLGKWQDKDDVRAA
jgi:glycogen synthase